MILHNHVERDDIRPPFMNATPVSDTQLQLIPAPPDQDENKMTSDPRCQTRPVH